MRVNHRLTLLASACALAACGSIKEAPQAPTLQSLSSQVITVTPDDIDVVPDSQAAKVYGQLLDTDGVTPAQRAEALRRLADLELERAGKAASETNETGSPDLKTVIARYQEQLALNPNAPNKEQVLYQLARAQEQAGELENAIVTLRRLVAEHPRTAYIDEANFRRGELAFSLGRFDDAESAYVDVLNADRATPFRERAQYMQGWSRLKRGQADQALQAFFKVLDSKLAASPGSDKLASPDKFNKADKELLSDTFRGISIALTQLKGAESIPAYLPANNNLRQSYGQFVYEQLADYFIKQDRLKDAADTYARFVQLNPLDGQAPRIQSLAIDTYEKAGLVPEMLQAQRQFVTVFGRDSGLRTVRSKAWHDAQPKVQSYLGDLARHYHASAQASKRLSDYQESVRWYKELIANFPGDPQTIRNNFLLAELLFEAKLYSEAAIEYERVAYDYPWHAQAQEAGYAALLTHAQLRKDADPLTLTRLQRDSVNSALRFAKHFPGSERANAVLTDAAETLYALKDSEQANRVAMKIISLQPPATEAQRRVAWTIMAQTAYQRGAFQAAEQAYARLAELAPAQEASRKELLENQVVSLYKSADQEKKVGNLKAAASQFKRVAEMAMQPDIRANALFDAGAAEIELKDWANAQATLESYRQLYPKHGLQHEVAPKLALAYGEQQKWGPAAKELERVLASTKDANLAKQLQWQIAEYFDKAGDTASATRAYERYLTTLLAARPVALVTAIETRHRLAQLAKREGNAKREMALLKDIMEADRQGGAARTDRTRYLGAMAALALAEPSAQAFRQVALVEPLQKQLKLKKAKLEEALNAYALASEPGVAEVSTAVTYQVAAMYRDFGKAILGSQRPKNLSAIELEQYDVLLEEQALPFEEKASETHEVNARRATQGIYDAWVRKSMDALAEMMPVRYGKRERGEGFDLAEVSEAKLAEMAKRLELTIYESPRPAAQLNQLGVVYRRMGKFDQSRNAYEQALSRDPSYAAAALNLGILSDLYVDDWAKAVSMYERYLTMASQGDAQVSKWLADLKRRKMPRQAAEPKKEAP